MTLLCSAGCWLVLLLGLLSACLLSCLSYCLLCNPDGCCDWAPVALFWGTALLWLSPAPSLSCKAACCFAGAEAPLLSALPEVL